jgi:hypothetical protein
MNWQTRMNHQRIREMADDGTFSNKIAEQLIVVGCPSNMAWRTFTVADGRGCSIADAFALVKEDRDFFDRKLPAAQPGKPAVAAPAKPAVKPVVASPTNSAPKPVATTPPAVRPAPVRQQELQPPRPPVDTWDVAIAKVNAEFGIKREATGLAKGGVWSA